MEIRGSRFVDDAGRTLLLRGVNLGGDSKRPLPHGAGVQEEFYDGASASFIGRPFPLEEASEHFSRLARWGQFFLRLVVPWEAIEHAGPGMHDTAYLDYIEALVEAAARFGVSVQIDPHQDVWSRWTGGDGAPMWSLEAVGFEPSALHASGAAFLKEEMGADYPRMQWYGNHLRLSCATMFTLFFAGEDYAPGIESEGVGIQEYLQSSYIGAFSALAARLGGYPNVAGFGAMNEPGIGFIGLKDIRRFKAEYRLPGLTPSPWEGMLAGEGIPTTAPEVGIRGLGLADIGRSQLGTPGTRAWKEGQTCLWRRVGVWDMSGDGPVLKQPSWFAPRAAVSPAEDFALRLYTFASRFAAATRGATKAARRFMLFFESPPNLPPHPPSAESPERVVNASHWYDTLTLMTKRASDFLAYDPEKRKPILGRNAVRRYFTRALAEVESRSAHTMGGCPTHLGEFGIPFDLDDRECFKTGDYRVHERKLSAYYDALDRNLMSAALWNYSARNRHATGDGWNDEDLSVFCLDEVGRKLPQGATAADSGGRALSGFVRPYAVATAGTPVRMRFNLNSGDFLFTYSPDRTIDAPTEIFVPTIQYPQGFSAYTDGCVAARRDVDGASFMDVRPEAGAAECSLRLRRL